MVSNHLLFNNPVTAAPKSMEYEYYQLPTVSTLVGKHSVELSMEAIYTSSDSPEWISVTPALLIRKASTKIVQLIKLSNESWGRYSGPTSVFLVGENDGDYSSIQIPFCGIIYL